MSYLQRNPDLILCGITLIWIFLKEEIHGFIILGTPKYIIKNYIQLTVELNKLTAKYYESEYHN